MYNSAIDFWRHKKNIKKILHIIKILNINQFYISFFEKKNTMSTQLPPESPVVEGSQENESSLNMKALKERLQAEQVKSMENDWSSSNILPTVMLKALKKKEKVTGSDNKVVSIPVSYTEYANLSVAQRFKVYQVWKGKTLYCLQ